MLDLQGPSRCEAPTVQDWEQWTHFSELGQLATFQEFVFGINVCMCAYRLGTAGVRSFWKQLVGRCDSTPACRALGLEAL